MDINELNAIYHVESQVLCKVSFVISYELTRLDRSNVIISAAFMTTGVCPFQGSNLIKNKVKR